MANFFNNNAGQQYASERQALEQRYNSSRANMLLVVVFTVINVILVATNSSMYFLFTASIPYMVTSLAMYWCGKYPAEEYIDWPAEESFLPESFFVTALVISAVIVVLYLLCWLFSKKGRVGWLIAALVLFAVDTVVMVVLMGISMDQIIDMVFHAWVLFSLGSGIYAHFKKKSLPEETPEQPAAEPGYGWDAPVPTPQAPTPAVEAPAQESPAEETPSTVE